MSANSSGLRFIGARAQPLRDRGQSTTNPRLVSLTQHFFLRGEQQEATQYKDVILEPDDAPEPRPEFDSFDKVPRSRRPLWAVTGLLLMGVVGFVTWRSFHLMARPGSTVEAAARAMIRAQREDPAVSMTPAPVASPPAQRPAPPARPAAAATLEPTETATGPASAPPAQPAATAPQLAAAPSPSAPQTALSSEPEANTPAPASAPNQTSATAASTSLPSESTADTPASASAAAPEPAAPQPASAPAAQATPPAPASQPSAPAAAATTEARAPSRMPGDGERNGGAKPKLRSRPLRGYVWSPATNGLVPAESGEPAPSPPASSAPADPAAGGAASTAPAATSPGSFESAPKPARESAPILE